MNKVDEARYRIRKSLCMTGQNTEDLGKLLGASMRTAQRRIERPDMLTLGELRKIAKEFRWNVADAAAVILQREITQKDLQQISM